MPGLEDVEKAFGGDFLKQFKEISVQSKKETFTEDMRKDAMRVIVNEIKGTTSRATYVSPINKTYNIIFCKAFKDLRMREFSNGTSMQFVDEAKAFWFSGVVPKDDVIKIQPEEYYVLVGYLYETKSKTDPNRVYNNMGVSLVFTMQEISEFKEQMEQEENETDDAIAAHEQEEVYDEEQAEEDARREESTE